MKLFIYSKYSIDTKTEEEGRENYGPYSMARKFNNLEFHRKLHLPANQLLGICAGKGYRHFFMDRNHKVGIKKNSIRKGCVSVTHRH